MHSTTRTAIAAIVATDDSLTGEERRAIIARMEQPAAGPRTPADRILSIRDTAGLFNRSGRCIKAWAKAGILPRVTLPGHKRACGFRLSDIEKLIAGKGVSV